MQQQEIVNHLKTLRENIISSFESFEAVKRFEKIPWEHCHGGGGEIALLRGDIFEKAAVNWSGVYGDKIPFDENLGPFFATGISIITHMHNPHAPTVHMNVRYIKTQKKSWFGGGYDLTPMGYPYKEDTLHFHDIAKQTLEPFGKHLYKEFSQNAKNYFYIKHRKRERGVGGIFFDYYNSDNFDADYAMWKAVGSTFLDAIIPIYQKRTSLSFTEEDKNTQNTHRAAYAEFNLIYDRGTKFGLASDGNKDAIFCSLPPPLW